jgi:hypothetical protein
LSGLDIVIVVAVIAAAVGGYQLGFLARVLSWAGLAELFCVSCRVCLYVVV